MNILRLKKAEIFSALLLILVFSLIYSLALQTPFHSDDYAYAIIGFDFDAHLNHYLTWSGRLVADLISPLLLAIPWHPVKAFVSAAATTLYLYTITTIVPKEWIHSSLSFCVRFLLIFIAYWTANSSLGQTTFWIVGSANYLWTHLFWVLYCKYLLQYCVRKEKSCFLFLLLFSPIAACTNENTAIFLPFITLAIAFYFYFFANKKIHTLIYLLCLQIVGLAVLLLAPGNAQRLISEGSEWYDIAFFDRLFIHIKRRFLPALGRSYPVLVLLFFFSFIIVKNKERLIKKLYFPTLFFLCGVASFAVMFFAPAFVARARSGGLMFFLCSLSFLLCIVPQLSHIQKKIFIALASLFSIFTLLSYACMYASYSQCFLQSQLRNTIIHEALADNKSSVTIPSYYYGFVMRGGDKISQFHNTHIAEFHGLKSVDLAEAPLDYSMVISEQGDNILQKELLECIHFTTLYSKKEFFRSITGVMLEFTLPNKDCDFIVEEILSLSFFTQSGEKIAPAKLSGNTLLALGKKYFLVSKLKKYKGKIGRVEIALRDGKKIDLLLEK